MWAKIIEFIMGLFESKYSEVDFKTPTKPVVPQTVFAWVVGHNLKSQGATNYLGETEFMFNRRIAKKAAFKLQQRGVGSMLIERPVGGGYTFQCEDVAKNAEVAGIKYAFCLHFNSAGVRALGCEVLINEPVNRYEFEVADVLSNMLHNRLGIKERDVDGVKELRAGHRGFTMLQKLREVGVMAMIPEPCFGNIKTHESEAVFENEDAYVDILVDCAYQLCTNKL